MLPRNRSLALFFEKCCLETAFEHMRSCFEDSNAVVEETTLRICRGYFFKMEDARKYMKRPILMYFRASSILKKTYADWTWATNSNLAYIHWSRLFLSISPHLPSHTLHNDSPKLVGLCCAMLGRHRPCWEGLLPWISKLWNGNYLMTQLSFASTMRQCMWWVKQVWNWSWPSARWPLSPKSNFKLNCGKLS